MTELDNKPLLLCDIDGVLNVLPRFRGHTTDLKRMNLRGYSVHIHEDAPSMVAELKKHFEIKFFSLWNQHSAPEVGPHVGLEDADYLPTSWEQGYDVMENQGYSPSEIQRYMYAKSPILPAYLSREGRPWVWVDDMVSSYDREYLEEYYDADRFRIVKTDESEGITWDSVDECIDFAQSLKINA